MAEKISKSDAEWQAELSAEQYRVLRLKGTERPFSQDPALTPPNSRYVCAGCGLEIFDSDDKFESGCGWPAFSAPLASAVEEDRDVSHGMVRTEVHCARCGGHLGHVFDDGPAAKGGLRYCINAVSMKPTPKP